MSGFSRPAILAADLFTLSGAAFAGFAAPADLAFKPVVFTVPDFGLPGPSLRVVFVSAFFEAGFLDFIKPLWVKRKVRGTFNHYVSLDTPDGAMEIRR